ncbi:MAG: hypothetical protein AB7F66_17630 [Bacteriovoracia bacterium]
MLADQLSAETRELLDDTGGVGIYQRMRVRIDGDERWISKKRLFDRDADQYSRSFVTGLEMAVRAYGRALAVLSGDIDPDDPEEYFDDDLTNVDFEILETVVETVTDNAETLKPPKE